MPEQFDIYDRSRTPTGRTILRGTPLKDEEYTIAVQVWIQNPQGRWLISKRAPGKSHSLKWEPTGGCVLAGEDSLRAALREVREELGIRLDPDAGILFASLRKDTPAWENPGFLDIWMFPADISEDAITMQPEEVCGMKWASSEEILTLIRAGAFVPIGEYTLHECLPDAVDLPSVRIARIRYMESVLDRVLSGENHSLLAEHLTILESYYHSPLWQADYAADEAGDIPLALKRGVLSQDTIYDLLTDNQSNTKAR